MAELFRSIFRCWKFGIGNEIAFCDWYRGVIKEATCVMPKGYVTTMKRSAWFREFSRRPSTPPHIAFYPDQISDAQ